MNIIHRPRRRTNNMNEELFRNWSFIYENTEDISIHVEAFSQKETYEEARLIFSEDYSTGFLKEYVGKDKVVHAELDGGCFELTIHAIKDGNIYIKLLERTSEYGWKESMKILLNKDNPRKMADLFYQGKRMGFFRVSVNEWEELAREIVL